MEKIFPCAKSVLCKKIRNEVWCTYISFKLWQQTRCQLRIWWNSEAAAGNNIYKSLFPNSFLIQKHICKYLIEAMNKIKGIAENNYYLKTFYIFIVVLWHSLITLLYPIQIIILIYLSYILGLLLQFLHIYFTAQHFFLYTIIIAPHKTFSYHW